MKTNVSYTTLAEQDKFIELHHLNEEDIHNRSSHHQSNF